MKKSVKISKIYTKKNIKFFIYLTYYKNGVFKINLLYNIVRIYIKISKL